MEQDVVSYAFGLVTFVDILGFRSLIETADAPTIARAVRHLQRFSSSRDLYGQHFSAPADPIVRAIAFSDSVVRVRLFGREPSADTIMLELRDMVVAQCEMVREGIFVRGGISAGEIYLDETDGNVLFGPALVRAYELESKYAIQPRIVIDPDLVDALYRRVEAEDSALRNADDYYDGVDSHLLIEDLKEFTSQLPNDLLQLDYLWAWRHLLDEEADWADFLRQHKRMILSNLALATLAMNASVKAKMTWLKGYHNRTIRFLIHHADKEGYRSSYDVVNYRFYLKQFLIR
ncbi:hypothetical protein [Sphingomonas sp.]|uniref:hypothetical protein n=1 Tax=Sphingomonas sp. TaxID=28214 RepID=UPI0025F4F212|nr:hypothetical protein [Sphingomonas sp.]